MESSLENKAFDAAARSLVAARPNVYVQTDWTESQNGAYRCAYCPARFENSALRANHVATAPRHCPRKDWSRDERATLNLIRALRRPWTTIYAGVGAGSGMAGLGGRPELKRSTKKVGSKRG